MSSIMKKHIKISVLSVLTALAYTGTAQAGWLCGPSHDAAAYEPYLETATDPHATQWRRDTWAVGDWTENADAARAQMDQMFRSGIFISFDDAKSMWHSHDTLTVGQSFYHLSGFDKRRAVALFDQMYQVTETSPSTLFLRDAHTGKVIGIYTRSGLQLQ